MRWFRTSDVALLMRVTPQTVRRWIKQDKLEARKVGSEWFILEPDLAKFAEGNSKYHFVPSERDPGVVALEILAAKFHNIRRFVFD